MNISLTCERNAIDEHYHTSQSFLGGNKDKNNVVY